MNRAKCFYLVRLYAIALVAITLIFLAGWHMGQHDYRQKVAAALKAGDKEGAIKMLEEWSKKDPEFRKDPLFFLQKATFHMDNGNKEVARKHLDRAIALLLGE